MAKLPKTFNRTRCTTAEHAALLALARDAKMTRSQAIRLAVRETAKVRGLWAPGKGARGEQ